MKRFSNILAVVNTGRNDVSALRRAITLTNSNQASLTVVSFLEDLPADMWMSTVAVSIEEIRDIAAAEELDRLKELVSAVGGERATIEKTVLVGRPFMEIIHKVMQGNHDLVIKNAEPSEGVLEVFFGSTDMHLMRKCPCPVWIIKPGINQFRRILACVDFDPGHPQNDALNLRIIEIATSLAVAESSELHIIHALEEFGERFLKYASIANTIVELETAVDEQVKVRKRWMNTLLDEQLKSMGKEITDLPNFQLHLVKDRAKHAIPAKARKLDVDLIILGTVSRTGIPGYFIGNTSENILNQVQCSVLTVKPPGFVSPVTL